MRDLGGKGPGRGGRGADCGGDGESRCLGSGHLDPLRGSGPRRRAPAWVGSAGSLSRKQSGRVSVPPLLAPPPALLPHPCGRSRRWVLSRVEKLIVPALLRDELIAVFPFAVDGGQPCWNEGTLGHI